MLFTLLIGLLALAFVVVYKYLMQNRGVVESFGIPMVKPFLIFGSPPYLYNQILVHKYYQDMAKKLGKTWGRYDGRSPCIVSTDSDFIKEVLVKHFDSFTDAFNFPTDPKETTLDSAMGEEWRALRKMLSPVFTSGKLKGMLDPMDHIADEAIDYITEQVKTNPEIDLKPILQGFTLDTISKCAFGLSTKAHRGENSDFAKAAYDVFSGFRADNLGMLLFFHTFSHFPFVMKYMNLWPESAHQIRQMTHDIIEERAKKNITTGDFIDKLRDELEKLEAPITRDMLDAQGIIFLTAGFETTANTLGHLMYNLSRNPDKQEIAFDEIMSVVEDSVINHETIKDLHYLLPKGTRIQLPIYACHYDEDYFPQPEKFEPERFLKENADKIVPYTWRPFGGGNRVCIGQRFALTEIKVFLAKLMRKYRIVATPKTKVDYHKGDLFLLFFSEMVVKLEAR